MKLLLSIITVFTCSTVLANKDSVIHLTHYALPDSVEAVSFIADVNLQSSNKTTYAAISSKNVTLKLQAGANRVSFQFPAEATVVANGVNISKNKNMLTWKYKCRLGEEYKLLIATASDSAENFTLFSGYIFLPDQNKWKLIGTCRINDTRKGIEEPVSYYNDQRKPQIRPAFSNVWVQRSSGSWKELSNGNKTPVINPLPNVDSVKQYQLDKYKIFQAVSSGKSPAMKDTAGVFYQVIDPGNGKSFTVSDTITVHYKLRIFGTDEVISGGSEKPDTFPLNRLIKAWQIAVPLVKTGGRINLVIPSGLGYSIRTRAAKIPPNSILVFEIEVLDAKLPAK